MKISAKPGLARTEGSAGHGYGMLLSSKSFSMDATHSLDNALGSSILKIQFQSKMGGSRSLLRVLAASAFLDAFLNILPSSSSMLGCAHNE